MAASGDPDAVIVAAVAAGVAAGVVAAGSAAVAGDSSSATVKTAVLAATAAAAAARSCFTEAATGAATAETLFAVQIRQIKDPCSSSPSHCNNGIIKKGPCTSRKKRKKSADLAEGWGGNGLPPELLHCIARRLDFFPDISSFASVCTSWRSVKRDTNGFRSHPPLLMLPPLDDDSSSSPSRREFYSISHGRGFELQFPAGDWKCIGASRGWLVMLDRNELRWFVFQLLNPLTKVSVRLPPVTLTNNNFIGPYHFTKVSVYGDPSKEDYKGGSSSPGSSCMVMMFWGRYDFLLCRPGDVLWTVMRTRFHCHHWFTLEVALFQGLYRSIAADTDGLYMISFDPCCKLNELGTAQARIKFPDPIDINKYSPRYMVECTGQLLLIIRRYTDLYLDYSKTSGFKVFRLDLERKEWTEVHNIGEQTIFIGCNQSVSLLSHDHPVWRGNCIYFTDDGYHGRDVFCDSGVFDLADRSISPFPLFDKEFTEPLVWLVQDNGCKTSSGIRS